MSGNSSTKSSVDSSGKSLSESSAKSLAVRTMVSNAKFEVEKFDGMKNFGMWQCKVMDVLVQQKLDITLEDKPERMLDKDWEKINRQACGTIRLCLAKNQKYFVLREIVRLNLFNHVLALLHAKFACNLAIRYPIFMWELCKGNV